MGRGTVPGQSSPLPKGNQPQPKPRLFLSELKAKREALAEELKELANRGFEDAWGIHYRKEDLPRVREVKAQIKALRQQIVEY